MFLSFAFSMQAQFTALTGVSNNKYRWNYDVTYTLDVEIDVNESNLQDMTWRPDGMMFYVIGATTDNIDQYTVTAPFDITGFSLDVSYDVSSVGSTIPTGMLWNEDGTELIVCDYGKRKLFSWTLTTGWDLGGTVTYNAASSAVSSNLYAVLTPRNENEGKYMWVCYNNTNWHRYDMSTAWDVSTMSTTAAQTISTSPYKWSNMIFNGNGSQVRVQDESSGTTGTYDLTTNWDITTITNLQTVTGPLTADVRMMTVHPARYDRIWLGRGASANVEVKQYDLTDN